MDWTRLIDRSWCPDHISYAPGQFVVAGLLLFRRGFRQWFDRKASPTEGGGGFFSTVNASALGLGGVSMGGGREFAIGSNEITARSRNAVPAPRSGFVSSAWIIPLWRITSPFRGENDSKNLFQLFPVGTDVNSADANPPAYDATVSGVTVRYLINYFPCRLVGTIKYSRTAVRKRENSTYSFYRKTFNYSPWLRYEVTVVAAVGTVYFVFRLSRTLNTPFNGARTFTYCTVNPFRRNLSSGYSKRRTNTRIPFFVHTKNCFSRSFIATDNWTSTFVFRYPRSCIQTYCSKYADIFFETSNNIRYDTIVRVKVVRWLNFARIFEVLFRRL